MYTIYAIKCVVFSWLSCFHKRRGTVIKSRIYIWSKSVLFKLISYTNPGLFNRSSLYTLLYRGNIYSTWWKTFKFEFLATNWSMGMALKQNKNCKVLKEFKYFLVNTLGHMSCIFCRIINNSKPIEFSWDRVNFEDNQEMCGPPLMMVYSTSCHGDYRVAATRRWFAGFIEKDRPIGLARLTISIRPWQDSSADRKWDRERLKELEELLNILHPVETFLLKGPYVSSQLWTLMFSDLFKVEPVTSNFSIQWFVSRK